MKVSTRVHYGLRAMTELARSYGDQRLLSLSEIARKEDLPLAYLEQLVGELRRAGLVEGTRGVHGGYRLSRGPAMITVGDVYRILEGEVAPVDCTAEDYLPGTCGRDLVCMSRSIWDRVQAAILGVLDSTTLDDLLISDALQHAVAGHGQSFVPVESLGASPSLPPRKGELAHA
jgi:Rrf2 family transcriptional regulator, cysteine metabolism repressor